MIFRPALLVLSSLAVLAGCGGGGGGGAAEPTVPFRVSISAQETTLSANTSNSVFGPETPFATTINVRITESNGTPVSDGTLVSLTVSASEIGLLSTISEPATQSESLQLTTSGGNASALFHTSDVTGQTSISASAFDSVANRNVQSSVTITVNDDVAPPQQVELTTERTTLPANPFGVPPFLGSPYLSEVTITFRDSSGQLSAPADGTVAASIDPVTRGAFSTLDDPTTTDVNEFFVLIGNGPVDMAAGTATVFVHSFSTPGPMVLRVTAQDPDTLETLSAELEFTVTEPASDGVPANVALSASRSLMYVQGSGGQTSQQLEALVFDGGREPVPDPVDNNNVLVELFTEGPNTGETVRARNASGTVVQGDSISIATTAGITSFNLDTGTQPGFLEVRVTADAADNNVDNGIGAPVSSSFEVEVSDGVPFAIALATVPAGPVATGASVTDANPNAPFPLSSNDVLAMQIEAVVTDRRGNPPARPVTIEFGLLDSPTDGFPSTGPGAFSLSGFDGNPVEGGFNFTAPTGRFQTAGGGAGPNDTLVLFGKDIVGNADLESARAVDTVLSQTSLRVDEPFNLNDFTGTSVNNGPVLPYAIGRAMLGNVETGAVTNENGVASTFLNYPVSSVGRSLILYAQGTNGDLPMGEFKTFGDVQLTVYPGVSPLVLFASPSSIPANTVQTVEVCAFDAAGVPIPGLFIDFEFNNSVGTGTVDGIPTAGTLVNSTGFDGCTLATVETTGIPAGTGQFVLTFEAGGVTTTVDIIPDEDALLQVQPSTLLGDNLLGHLVTIRYLNANGEGIENVQITGTCTSDQGAINFVQEPGVTDENGETTARISMEGFDAICPDDEPGEGTCEFSVASGDPTAELTARGRDAALVQTSPAPASCDTDDTGGTLTVEFSEVEPGNNDGGAIVGAVGTTASAEIVSGDGLINCGLAIGSTASVGTDCSETYDTDTQVSLELTVPATGLMTEPEICPNPGVPTDSANEPGCFLGWDGACSGFAQSLTATVQVDSNQNCIARFR
ncbi:MAG: hypothetical protein R3200_10310 [Xanthomonadales bacterium]|nr:hypothetical protein [Xanthomonadales bacterium]